MLIKSFMRLFILTFLTSAGVLHAQGYDYGAFAGLQKKVPREAVARRLDRFIVKDKDIADHYAIDENALSIYATPQDKLSGKAEFVFEFGTPSPSPRRPDTSPLRGKRIAIDPGHIGGATAFVEMRYIDMSPSEDVGQRHDLQFNEGDLNLATAKYLQKLLRASGAETFLTREKSGQGVYSKPFFQWLHEDFARTSAEACNALGNSLERKRAKHTHYHKYSLTDIFRKFYNPLDLRARIDAINAFGPNAVIIVHYNLGQAYDAENGLNPGTEKNTTFAFIPGGFMRGELRKKEARVELARLAVTEDLDLSFRLAEDVVARFADKLALKPSPPSSMADNSIGVVPGVFCRNLMLTREIHAPLCYGEAFYQDNFETCRLIADYQETIDGLPLPQHAKKVAEAYFEALEAFFTDT